VFTTTPRHRKDDARLRTQQEAEKGKAETPESMKPETVQKEKPTAQSQDALLSEKNVSTTEQRKADWAIIKEMSQYLWPKVGLVDMSRT